MLDIYIRSISFPLVFLSLRPGSSGVAGIEVLFQQMQLEEKKLFKKHQEQFFRHSTKSKRMQYERSKLH
jgi:hypothetical protein